MATEQQPFIKLIKSELVLEMLRDRPTALNLIMLIALRAKRRNTLDTSSTKIGEALIGDFQSYGVSEQVYRSDKNYLKINGLVTFKPTPKGTIAKLVDSTIIDINVDTANGRASENQRTANGQLTTKEEYKNIRNKNKYINTGSKNLEKTDFEEIAKILQVKPLDAERAYEAMQDYMKSSGKSYKDEKAALRNWIRRNIESGKTKQIVTAATVTDPLLRATIERNERWN